MSRIVPLYLGVSLLFFGLSPVRANPPEFVYGILRAADTPTYVAQPCDGLKLTTCQSCDTIQLCLGGLFNSLNLTRKCPSSAPYCVQSESGGLCQTSPDSQCQASSTSGFICTGLGFFPDPDSCQKYHYCEEKGVAGDTYECPLGYRYNSRSQQCQWFNYRRCETVKCDPASQKVFIPYPLDSTFYAYCQFDYSTPTPTYQRAFMLSCGKGSTFDVEKEVCTFQCRSAGLFVNTANPSQYFSCYWQNNQWMVSVKTCSKPNYIFDEALMRCKSDPEVTTTTASSTTTVTATTTTVSPSTTTVDSSSTKMSSSSTTVDSSSTTMSSSSTTVDSSSTTVEPSSTTVDSSSTTVDSSSSTVDPSSSTVDPNALTSTTTTSDASGSTSVARLVHPTSARKTNCLGYRKDALHRIKILE